MSRAALTTERAIPGRVGGLAASQGPAFDDYWAAVPTLLQWRSVRWMLSAGVSQADLADGLAGRDYHTETIYTTRGCRGRCVVCANHLVGGGWRPRSVDSILYELSTIPPPRRGPQKVVKFWG